MFARPIPQLLGRSWARFSFHSTAAFWASKRTVHKFKLADIGEGITECEVIKWCVCSGRTQRLTLKDISAHRSVKPSQTVQAFDPLCEVQSDKASVEITSPFEGVVKELLVQEGDVAKVGAGLCLIEVDEEVEEVKQEASTPAVEIAQPSVEESVLKKRGVHPLDPKYVPEPGQARKEDVFAAPSVRHLARQNGVDLGSLVPGSGKAGRIEKQDVEAYLARGPTTEQAAPSTVADQQEDVVVELGRTRYGMWKAMVKVTGVSLSRNEFIDHSLEPRNSTFWLLDYSGRDRVAQSSTHI
jgi:2-oxoisovalerate dehydrogenase E2 component (dihydrolipoyl transacylase)